MSALATPHDHHAECQVIAGAILDREVVELVGDTLSPDGSDFYTNHHPQIWAAVVAVARTGAAADVGAVSSQLKSAGAHEGAQDVLLESTGMLPSMQDVEIYARKIRDRAAMRAAAAAARSLLSSLESGVDDDAAWLDGAEGAIAKAIECRSEDGEMMSAGDAVVECWESLVARCEAGGGHQGYSSGLSELDDALSGFCPGKVYVIGGRPGMGKSMLAKDLVVGLAKQGLPVAVFSLEMPRRQWVDRMICGEAGVSFEDWRDGRLDQRAMKRVMAASEVCSKLPIEISDKAGVSIEYVQRWSRRVKRKHGKLGGIMIDYLQLMRAQQKIDSREQEIAHISRMTKEMAKELGCPAFPLAQLNRSVESRDNKRPGLADLRESGSIEQDADAVLMCYRDEYYNPNGPDKGVMEVDIAKNRDGQTGPVRLAWQGDRARVANLQKEVFE